MNTTAKQNQTDDAYGIRWSEFNRSSQRITRERTFGTAKARDAFANKIEQRASFNAFEAWLDPRPEEN